MVNNHQQHPTLPLPARRLFPRGSLARTTDFGIMGHDDLSSSNCPGVAMGGVGYNK